MNTNELRAIKPPIVIPNEWAWLWWTLAALLLAAAALALWLRWKRRRQAVIPEPVIPPHVRARQKLQEALQHISDANRFCTLVADTARVYLEERFSLRAPERTTEEFLLELPTSPHLTRDQKQALAEFLQSCDLVKFARFEPTEAALRQLHDAALRLVDETQFEPINTAATPTPPPPMPVPQSS